MINKDKINRALVYRADGTLAVITSSVHFPKDFFKVKGMDFVMLKGTALPVFSKGEPVEVIFEFVNGTRVKYKTTVDISTE